MCIFTTANEEAIPDFSSSFVPMQQPTHKEKNAAGYAVNKQLGNQKNSECIGKQVYSEGDPEPMMDLDDADDDDTDMAR